MKILSQESNIGTASSVSSATAVRIYNSDSSAGIVTRTDSDDNTIGKLTVPAGEVLYLEKKSTDKLVAPSTVLASKVAYSHMMYYASAAIAGTAPTYVTDNLVFHIDAGDINSYDSENSATTVNSLVGNITSSGYNQNISYSPSNGGYWTFSGNNTANGIEFDSITSFMPLGSSKMTYEVWMKPTFDFNGVLELVRKLPAERINFGIIHFTGNSTTDSLSAVKGTSNTSTASDAKNTGLYSQPSSWTHVIVSHDTNTSNVKIYINGTEELDATDSTNWSSYFSGNDYILRIGKMSGTHTVGDISIVRIYKGKALTASEVDDNYNAEKARYGYS